jgi:ATP-binding protein involved in chromosome partitioning
MSIVYYAGGRTSPLRGVDISNAMIELLAVVRWGALDYLVMDMPPGISDTILDTVRFVRKARFLIVTTPSKLAFETVRKLITLLKDLNVPILGVIENMRMKSSRFIQQQVEGMGVNFWGAIPFDTKLEDAIGDVKKLSETEFGKGMEDITVKNLNLED